MASQWWRDAVIYQIYPRSFFDANGDGVGDLTGITAKLGDLVDLGVDAIWMSPVTTSPQKDGGYDVADYCDVDPLFGSLADFDELLTRAHEVGLHVLVDLVPNHTSNQHPWFQRALAGSPGSPERDYYLFRDGRGPNGAEPPNNWVSMFGGPAWTRVSGADGKPGQWYCHLFDSSQPDLNWVNPAVQLEFEKILRFWLERGVDGFRVDQPHAMAKAAGLPDHPYVAEAGAGFIEGREAPPMWFQPEVHEIFRRWRSILGEYTGERAMCGEAYVLPLSFLAQWVRPDEFQQTFNFRFLDADWNASSIHAAVDESFDAFGAVGAPSTWVLSNHDVVRHASRFGGLTGRPTASDGVGPSDPQPDAALGLRRARAATLFTAALPGSMYLYQGEELGLPEHTTLAPEFRQDPTFARTGGKRLGRDGCRVPLPWVGGAGVSNGFSSSDRAWLPQPPAFAELARDRQNGVAGSTLELYKSALAIRKNLKLGAGLFDWVPALCTATALGFTNGPVSVVHNFGIEPLSLPAQIGAVLLESEPGAANGGALAPNATAWFSVK